MNWADLQDFVGAGAADEAQLTIALATAEALVSARVGSAVVPQVILDRAILGAASELYNQKDAPNGIAQFNTFDAAPIRVARDPMVAAYPILRPFLPLGFA
jgi:hypothetical protein